MEKKTYKMVALVCARPEFGTSLTFTETPEIHKLTGLIADKLASVDDKLQYTLSGLISGSENQQNILLTYGENLATKGKLLTDAFLSTIAATTDLQATFASLQSVYTDLYTSVIATSPAFLDSVDSSFSLLLTLELVDTIVLTLSSLQQAQADGSALYNGLVNSDSQEELDELLRELVVTLDTLNAHLPAVVYVFQRAGQNIQTADTFYVAYTSSVSSMVPQFISDTLEFFSEFDDLASSLGENLNDLSSVYSTVHGNLMSGLSGSVSSVSSFGGLVSSLQPFLTIGPSVRDTLLSSNLPDAVQNYIFGIESAVDGYYNSPVLYFAADALVEGLIASDMFAEYCFAKYEGLVADVPNLGDIRLNECLDTERPRLHKLRRTIRKFIQLLSYDLEDLYFNLEPCLKHRYHRNACFSDFTALYTTLGVDHLSKHFALRDLIEVELVASSTRLQTCLAAANYYTFDNLVPTLIYDLSYCYAPNIPSCEGEALL